MTDTGRVSFNVSQTYGGVISGPARSAPPVAPSSSAAQTPTRGSQASSSGTLQIGSGGTSGAIVGNVINNGTLAFNRSDSFTVVGSISGTGSLLQIGSGTTILTGSNSYSGGTTITAGGIQVATADNLGTGTAAINGGQLVAGSFDRSTRTLYLNGGTLTVSGGTYTHATSSGTAANILTLNGTGSPLLQR